MRRGFSLLELMVASLLLGMLMTILTMIFSQSSIAWRTGIANLCDLDDVRMKTGQIRTEADNVYIWQNDQQEVATIVPIWRYDVVEGAKGVDRLRNRAITIFTNRGGQSETIQDWEKVSGITSTLKPDLLRNDKSDFEVSDLIGDFSINCGEGEGASSSASVTYTINVRSAGPDRKDDTYDDIWSYPDDFDL